MASNPIYLTLLRRGDMHIVDLAEVQAIIPRSETRVDGAFLEEISQEIKRITGLVGTGFRRSVASPEPEHKRTPHVVRELKTLGSVIFSHLLTQAAREKLRSSESCDLYLRLDDQLVHIPWELAFDGQQFLGMKFRVGRQIITHHRVSQTTPRRINSGVLRLLIISDPSETLESVSRESEQLCEVVDGIPGLQVRLYGGRGVKRIPLLAALRESDIVHFAGHSQFDEKNPESSGWLLYDGLLPASEISKLDRAPLLVFSNSCQAGATKNWHGNNLFEGQAFGLGSGFLLGGVRNYVGTFCVVHDEQSRFFAVEFYRGIAQGETIGHALLAARLATAREMGLDQLTWAGYMLYGDPAFRLDQSLTVGEGEIKGGDLRKTDRAETPSFPKERKRDYSRRKGVAFAIFTTLLLLVGLALLTVTPDRWAGLVKSLNLSSKPVATVPGPLLEEYALAYREFGRGEVTSARARFNRLINDAENSNGLGFDGLAAIYLEAGFLDKASGAIRQAEHRGHANPMLYLLQGDVYASRGEIEKALDAFRRAASGTSIIPWQRSATHNALGALHYRKGMAQKAEEEFLHALAEAPQESTTAYSNLGFLYRKMGDVIRARQMFEKALSIRPSDLVATYFLGTLETKGKHEDRLGQPRGKIEQAYLLPLTQAGGMIRRLGYGEALTGLVRQALEEEGVDVSVANRGRDWRGGRLGPLALADSKSALELAQEKRVGLAIFGSYESFINTFAVDVKVVRTEGAQLLATIRFKTQGEDKLLAVVRQLAQRLRRLIEAHGKVASPA